MKIKNNLLFTLVILIFALPSSSSVLASSIVNYQLYDDGISNIQTICSKNTNSQGVSIINKSIEKYGVPFYQGVTELILNGNIIDTIYPTSDYIHSGVYSNSVNNSNQVVGWYKDNSLPTSAQSDAYVWQNGILKIIARSMGGGMRANATDINNYGYVTGYISSNSGFIWHKGTFYSLGRIGTGYVFPRCINDDGIITGDALDGSFQQHAMHWIPLDANGNYNNGYDNYYNNGFNNGYNNNYNNGYIAQN